MFIYHKYIVCCHMTVALYTSIGIVHIETNIFQNLLYQSLMHKYNLHF